MSPCGPPSSYSPCCCLYWLVKLLTCKWAGSRIVQAPLNVCWLRGSHAGCKIWQRFWFCWILVVAACTLVSKLVITFWWKAPNPALLMRWKLDTNVFLRIHSSLSNFKTETWTCHRHFRFCWLLWIELRSFNLCLEPSTPNSLVDVNIGSVRDSLASKSWRNWK